jgi:eukaryotic-like serine/threonine-protein kinase
MLIILSVSLILTLGNIGILNEALAIFENKPDQSFITYDNSKMRFSLMYPSNWQMEEHFNGFVTFTAPIEDYTQKRFPAGLGIFPLTLESQNISLTTLKNVNLKNLTSNLKEFQLLGAKQIILPGNYPAQQIVFTALDGDEIRKSMQIIVKNQDKAYLITYKADLSKYDSYLQTIQKILETLVLTK